MEAASPTERRESLSDENLSHGRQLEYKHANGNRHAHEKKNENENAHEHEYKYEYKYEYKQEHAREHAHDYRHAHEHKHEHFSSVRVDINVSGKTYQTKWSTINKYPTTLLGDYKKRMEYYCPHRNEYYFNRHRDSFESILFFYQSSGKLCRPNNIDLNVFTEECEFWELPLWAIKYMKIKERGVLQDYVHEILNPTVKEALSFRKRMWNFLVHWDSSIYARSFAFLYMFIVFLSILTICLKSVDSLHSHGHSKYNPLDVTEFVLNTIFCLEFIARFIVSPIKSRFFKSFIVWIDVIALLPYFVNIMNHHLRDESFIRSFQLFRVCRLFRIAKTSQGFQITAIILKDSWEDIQLFVTCLSIYVIFGATIIYHLEHATGATQFTSIPQSMWWGIQTCVTLGYGDVIPRTFFGKLFSTVFMFAVIPTLSIPIMSVIIKFTKYFAFSRAMRDEAASAN